MATRPLLDLRPAEIEAIVEGPTRMRNVYRAIDRGDGPLAAIGRDARARLRAATHFSLPTIVHEVSADDGTRKYALGLDDGREIETVLIPEASRSTVCVSTQVGCKRACGFCATAQMGLVRNLRPEEIVAQVLIARQSARAHRLPEVRNVVLMGMGEPLDNWPATLVALEILVDGFEVGPRHVTISTVGPNPKAVHALMNAPGRIAWSLHAAREEVRTRLIATHRSPLPELRKAFAEVCVARKQPLFVELALIDGENDAPVDAAALVDFFAGFPVEVRFNLLPMNPVHHSSLATSTEKRVEAFAQTVRAAGHFCMVRRARGHTASAACGQLVRLGADRPGTGD